MFDGAGIGYNHDRNKLDRYNHDHYNHDRYKQRYLNFLGRPPSLLFGNYSIMSPNDRYNHDIYSRKNAIAI